MKKYLLIFSFISFAHSQHSSLRGYVTDSLNSEHISDVVIQINKNILGGYSNSYGYFFVESDTPIVSLLFRRIGYKWKTVNVANINKDTLLKIALNPEIDELDSVVIEGKYYSDLKSGRNIISIADIKQMPVVGGEADLVKSIQLFPSVLTSTEGGTSFHVRGGDFDQNLILLDGIPVYNINHFFGLLSAFNIDALKDIKFIRSGFEPKYGGKLSSVLVLTMKEGNQNKFEYMGGISLISSRVLIEGPVLSNTTMMFSARRTYLDPVINYINNKLPPQSDKLPEYYYYDINAKIKTELSDVSKLYLSSYLGKDKFSLSDVTSSTNNQTNMIWGNQTHLMRWNYVWSERLFSNISIGYTHFGADIDVNIMKFATQQRKPDITDYIGNINIDYYFSNNFFVNVGYQSTQHYIGISKREQNLVFGEQNIFADVETSMDEFQINAGARFVLLPSINYYTFNPRLNINYQLSEALKLNASIDYMTQPIHLLSFNNILNPGDLFLPSSKILKPQESLQYSAGIAYLLDLEEYTISTSVNAYFKTMKNSFTLIYNNSNITMESITDNISIGSGTAQGVELEMDFQMKKFKILANYSYLNSWRTNSQKNRGEKFHPIFDRTHYLNMFAQYPLSQSLFFAVTFKIASGMIINYAVQKYELNGYGGIRGGTYFDYGQLNEIKADANMKLDVSMTYKLSDHWEFFVSIYNVLGNAYPLFYRYDDFGNNKNYTATSIKMLPTFGFNFKY